MVWSSPALSQDGLTVFVGSSDHHLYAVNAKTGVQNWNFTTGDRVWSSPALSQDGSTVFVGSNDHHLYAVAASTGVQQWAFTTGDVINKNPALSPDGATVFVGSVDGHLYAVSAGAPQRYVCLDNHCWPSNMTTVGVPLSACQADCGTAALKYKCIDSPKKCVPDDNGTAYERCQEHCL